MTASSERRKGTVKHNLKNIKKNKLHTALMVKAEQGVKDKK